MGIKPTYEAWEQWKRLEFNLCRSTHTVRGKLKAYSRVVRSGPPAPPALFHKKSIGGSIPACCMACPLALSFETASEDSHLARYCQRRQN